MPRKNSAGIYVFADHPEFTPNLSPKEMFALGIFGGTYFRPIYSRVTSRSYKNAWKEFPSSWFAGLDIETEVASSDIDLSINKYGVWSGTSLEYWESKGWIKAQDPYGWVQWYMRFFMGRRTPDDQRQIDRWIGIQSRFGKRLVSMCKAARKNINNSTVSPVIRQLLIQWAVLY